MGGWIYSVKVFLFGLFTALCSIAWAEQIYPAEPLRTVGKIESVTVFPDRAIVKRVYRPDGNVRGGSVLFVDFPTSFDATSVRAAGEGVQVTGFSLRQLAAEERNREKILPLRAKIGELEARQREINDALHNAREQMKLLDSFGRLSTAQSDREARANEVSVKNWNEVLIFVGSKRAAFQKDIRALDSENQQIASELQRLKQQIAELAMQSKFSPYAVEVAYSGKNGSVAVEYQVSGVSWRGVYDLVGSADGNDFQFTANAVVRQRTGEDWPEATILLSTAQPSSGMSPGVLQPWRISSNDPGGSMGAVNRKSGRAEVMGDAAYDSDDEAIEHEGAEISDAASLSILLPGKETILSDNSDHRVLLSKTELKGNVSHVAIPSISPYVYLFAKLRNTGVSPMPAGSLNVFLDGSFSGTTTLPVRVAAGEEFSLYLGNDQRMQVLRRLKKGDVESSGVFTKKVEVVNQWEIEVVNGTRKNRQITVYDQYPVSADPAITTRYGGSSLAAAQKDENGILTFKLDLKSGAREKFDFKYSMEFPREVWDKFVARQNQQLMKDRPAAQEMNQAPQQYNLEKMMRKK